MEQEVIERGKAEILETLITEGRPQGLNGCCLTKRWLQRRIR